MIAPAAIPVMKAKGMQSERGSEAAMHIQSELVAVCLFMASHAVAQTVRIPDPLVRENATIKLAEHTFVIPDGDVFLVPNVGIIVGNRATLVIDPGLGRLNGEAVLREVIKISHNSELYIASTHYHVEHTTGYLAFPRTAKYITSNVQEAEFAESAAAQIKPVLGDVPVDCEVARGCGRPEARHHV